MIICCMGKARVGKDSLGVMLAEELFNLTGQRFVLMAYAHELKNRLQRDFDLSYEQLWGNEKEIEDKRYPKKTGGFWTPREMMQFFGTECMRAMDNEFWTKSLFRTIEEKEFKNVIITDVRFPNEADPVVEQDGYVIKVNRENKDEVHGETHASEISIDNYDKIDFTVENNSDLAALRETAKQISKILIENEKIKFKLNGGI